MSGFQSNGHVALNEQVNAVSVSRPSLFWPAEIPGKIRWHEPALPVENAESLETQTGEMLEELRMRLQSIPLRAWELLFNYRTQAVNATREREALERQAREELMAFNLRVEAQRKCLVAQIADLETRAIPIEEALALAKHRFGSAAAQVGLVCDPDQASPQVLEQALERLAPTDLELSGNDRVIPLETADQSANSRWSRPWFEWFAAGISGIMLGLSLGVLTNLLSISDLQRFEGLPRLLLATMAGSAIVMATGDLVSSAWRSLAHALEVRRTDCPRLRLDLVMAVLHVGFSFIVAGAEVTSEAYGIKTLHQQQDRQERRLNRRAESTVLPIGVYALIGTLITCPYLFRKAAKAWGSSEVAQRKAWQHATRAQALEAMRKEPAIQGAFALAYDISRLTRVHSQLAAQAQELAHQRDALQPRVTLDAETQARITAAHEAAVGAAAALHQGIRELIELHEPLSAIRPASE